MKYHQHWLVRGKECCGTRPVRLGANLDGVRLSRPSISSCASSQLGQDDIINPKQLQVGLRGEPQPEPDRRQSHRDAGHRRASSHARPSKDAPSNDARSSREVQSE